jgi:hypothetical protein
VPKKERRKRVTKKEESDEDVKADSEDEVMPTRTSRSRRSTKKEESADELGIEDEAKPSVEDKPAKKPRAKKVKQEAVTENGAAESHLEEENGRANGTNGTKKEPKEEPAGIKPEPEEDGVVEMPDKATKPRAKKAKRESIKKEERDGAAVASQVKNEDEDVVDVKPKRGRPVKKEANSEENVDGDAEAEEEEEEETRGKKMPKAVPTKEVNAAKTRTRRSRG